MDTGSLDEKRGAGAQEADGHGPNAGASLSAKPAKAGTEGRWTENEHAAFILGLNHYGRQWMRISKEYVPTRTPVQVRSHAQKFLVQCDRLAASSQRTEVDSPDGGLEALADLGGAALRRDEKRGRNDLTALIGDLPPSAKPYSFGSETDQAAAEAIGRRASRAARAEAAAAAAEPPMGGLDGGASLLSGPSPLDSAWGTRSSVSTLGGSTYGGPSSWPTLSSSTSSEDGGQGGEGGMVRAMPSVYGMMPVPPAESYMTAIAHQQQASMMRAGPAYGAHHGGQQGWGSGGAQQQQQHRGQLPSHGSDPLGGVGELPSVYGGGPSGGGGGHRSKGMPKAAASDAGMDGGEQESADAAALALAMAQAQWLAVAAQQQAAKVLAMQAVVAQRQASKLATASYGNAPSHAMYDYSGGQGGGGMPPSYFASMRPGHGGGMQGPPSGK